MNCLKVECLVPERKLTMNKGERSSHHRWQIFRYPLQFYFGFYLFKFQLSFVLGVKALHGRFLYASPDSSKSSHNEDTSPSEASFHGPF